MEGDIDPAGDRDGFSHVLIDCPRVVIEDLGDHGDLAARVRDRFADVLSLKARQLLSVLLDKGGDPS
jgi:hypothetical protein